jgi:hypothetical protein
MGVQKKAFVLPEINTDFDTGEARYWTPGVAKKTHAYNPQAQAL